MTDPGFDDSRRLTGANPYFAVPGAALEGTGRVADMAQAVADWRCAVTEACALLDWPEPDLHARVHASGVTLALSAPVDQLFCATEVNEWAWLSALYTQTPRVAADCRFHAPAHAAAWDSESAEQTLRGLAQTERNPRLVALVQAAAAHQLPLLLDDELLSIGSGARCVSWSVDELPAVDQLSWQQLGSIPVALVTGSNGKTTTTRLLAALLGADGRRVTYSSTDGLFLGRELIEAADYSGPAGARAVLRHPQAQAAVLESARGGLLRRGLAVQQADLAVVTNISADHFGEYGVHSLADLAAVKLSVAKALHAQAPLLVNADDALLREQALSLPCRRAWFGLDAQRLPEAGSDYCVLENGHLWLSCRGRRDDLGDVALMPLSFAGLARYNIANLAAAALAAALMGVAVASICTTLQHFGSDRHHNPGRLQHWNIDGVQVFVDYAHNPDGLRSLLRVASAARGDARLALLLGQAGNREDPEIRALAAVAAEFAPARVLLKDIEGYIRGRQAGEVAAVLRQELLRCGIADRDIVDCLDETVAARQLLDWAQPGDVLVLPVHGVVARRNVVAELEARVAGDQLDGRSPAASPQ